VSEAASGIFKPVRDRWASPPPPPPPPPPPAAASETRAVTLAKEKLVGLALLGPASIALSLSLSLSLSRSLAPFFSRVLRAKEPSASFSADFVLLIDRLLNSAVFELFI
jgi:hypothetical protein